MFIGSRLKELRKDRKMTQTELGDLLNVTKVSVCCYEKGTRTPSLDTLDDLSDIFNVRPDYFLGKEVAFLKELKKNKKLYNMILEDPKRSIELIIKKLK